MKNFYNVTNKYLLKKILIEDISNYFFNERVLPIFSSNKIFVSKSKMKDAGNGIFAKTNIKAGEILEINKYIKADQGNEQLKEYGYYNENKEMCISSGLGSFYCTAFKEEDVNIDHLVIQNLDNYMDANLIIVYAGKDIQKNKELLYFYGQDALASLEGKISPEVSIK